MTLQEQAQTIRFFEGLGKRLSSREFEIWAQDEEDGLNTFLLGDGKEGGFEGLTGLINQSGGLEEEAEKRTCAECQYFIAGRFSSYCCEFHFHRPREVEAGNPVCEWFGRRG